MLFLTKGFTMQKYFGNPCPWCGKNFAEGDDIVVCPECGTPHHRDCYKEHSACANEEKHGEDFEWKAPVVVRVVKAEASRENGTVSCAHCGNENPASSRYCSNCGAPLGERERAHRAPTPEEEFLRERERLAAESLNSDIGGITAKEAAIYVRSNIGYFLPRFAAFSKGAKFDTNFAAFFLSYFYLFYRKMYGLGIAVFAAISILNIPTLLLDIANIQEQYVSMGLLSRVIWEIPHQKELAVYSIVANIFIWAIRIALMIFFNRIYFSKVVKNVETARRNLANQSENAISEFFRKKGGTSLVVPIIAVCLLLLASFVFAGFIVSSEFFIMPEMTNFL